MEIFSAFAILGSSDSWFTAVAGRGDGMSPRQSTERDQISSERLDILRCRAVGISEPVESSIAINAAERTKSNCAQEMPFHWPAAMRPKYLGTPATMVRSD
jgi:hypothetical protein